MILRAVESSRWVGLPMSFTSRKSTQSASSSASVPLMHNRWRFGKLSRMPVSTTPLPTSSASSVSCPKAAGSRPAYPATMTGRSARHSRCASWPNACGSGPSRAGTASRLKSGSGTGSSSGVSCRPASRAT
ncbi:MAG TPA: hypothetical protein VG268_07285 [Streptosporangiaceae bacterium]|nr:hypothetical protein [Streptosporangiaceae bacterium]